MRDWVPVLAAAEQPPLVDIGARFAPLVDEADVAVADQKAVARRWVDFEKIGSRCKLIDDFNSLRYSLHADLCKLRETPEGKGLPTDFADRFFSREHRPSTSTPAPTVAEVETRLQAARQQVAELEAQLEALRKEELAREQEEARRLSDEAALADAERRVKELRAKLGK